MIKIKIEIREVSSNGGEWVLNVNNELRGIYGQTKRLKESVLSCIDNAIIDEANEQGNFNE